MIAPECVRASVGFAVEAPALKLRHDVKRSSLADLVAHLRALGLDAGDDVVVHSRLISFGVIDGHPPAVAYDALREVVGADATIAAPTYVFAGEDAVYDAEATPSTNAGVLSEYIRRLPGAVRSASPVHNHAAVGPKATLFAQTPSTTSFGPGSDFELMFENRFALLLLGCKLSQGATYLHHLEAVTEVPYRHWVISDKRVRERSGRECSVRLNYFARRDDTWVEDFDALEADLVGAKVLKKESAPYGPSFCAPLIELDAAVRSIIELDPYALVSPNGD